jgi:hypothetical protein
MDSDEDLEYADEFFFGHASVESNRQFSAQAAAENAAARRRRTAQRGRSTGRSTTAGRRRAASDPGQSRARRRRTAPAEGPPVVDSARGRGPTASSAAARADAGQPAEDHQATPDDIWEFVQEMQAEAAHERELEAELAAEAAAAAEALTGERSRWGQRCEEEEGRWHASAPIIGAAVLQLHAAPEPEVACSSCQAQGCTVRYVGSRVQQRYVLRHKLVPCQTCRLTIAAAVQTAAVQTSVKLFMH